tara:strand:- start:102 stop:467 length:366 start_codon:yes stop_codon:yes gene_type:complete
MTLNIDAMMTTNDIDKMFLPSKIDVMVRGEKWSVRKIIKKRWIMWVAGRNDGVSIYDCMTKEQQDKFDDGYDNIGVVDIGRFQHKLEWIPDEDVYESELMSKFYELMRFMNGYCLTHLFIS